MRSEFRTNTRGYVLALDQDLFGAYILHRHWWGLMNKRGGSMRQLYLSHDQAIDEFHRVERTRLRHGYVQVDKQSTT